MLDWQGLLKFSLKYSDGTHKSEFHEMKEEDRKFLQGALDEFCNVEMKKLFELIKKLDEEVSADVTKSQIDILEQLQQLLDSLDKGGLLYKMNGHIPLLKIVFYSKQEQDRILSLQILAAANQNDATVQNQSINSGALQLMELIQKQQSMKIKQSMMSTVSSIVRGENLQAKRIFIQINGLQLLKDMLQKQPSERLQSKINTLFRDLIYYDEFLHQTYKDLSSFSNTAGLKIDAKTQGLEYDINKQKLKENFLEKNQKYKGFINKFLTENLEIKKQYEDWLKKQQANN